MSLRILRSFRAMDSLTRKRRGAGPSEAEKSSVAREQAYAAALSQAEASGVSGAGTSAAPASGAPGEASPGTLESGEAVRRGETTELPTANPFYSEHAKAEIELIRNRPAALSEEGLRSARDYDEAALGDAAPRFVGEPNYESMGAFQGSNPEVPRVARVELMAEEPGQSHSPGASTGGTAFQEGAAQPAKQQGNWEVPPIAQAESSRTGEIPRDREVLEQPEDSQELIPAESERLGRVEDLLVRVIEENRQLKRRLEQTESRSTGSWHSGVAHPEAAFSPATFGPRPGVDVQQFLVSDFSGQAGCGLSGQGLKVMGVGYESSFPGSPHSWPGQVQGMIPGNLGGSGLGPCSMGLAWRGSEQSRQEQVSPLPLPAPPSTIISGTRTEAQTLGEGPQSMRQFTEEAIANQRGLQQNSGFQTPRETSGVRPGFDAQGYPLSPGGTSIRPPPLPPAAGPGPATMSAGAPNQPQGLLGQGVSGAAGTCGALGLLGDRGLDGVSGVQVDQARASVARPTGDSGPARVTGVSGVSGLPGLGVHPGGNFASGALGASGLEGGLGLGPLQGSGTGEASLAGGALGLGGIPGLGGVGGPLITAAEGVRPEEPARYVSELPKLPQAELSQSAIVCGNWLAQVRQIMVGLSQSAGVWWQGVEGPATAAYKRWLVADPLGRLGIDPSTVKGDFDTHLYGRVESRAVSLLLAAVPQSVRDDVVTNRWLSSAGILFRVLCLFQPGGSSERSHLLSQLVGPDSCKNFGDAIKTLRRWQQGLQRAAEIHATLPDASLLLRGVDNATAGLLTSHPMIGFRVNAFRHQLAIDYNPTVTSVVQLVRLIQAECEAASITSEASDKRAKTAAANTATANAAALSAASGGAAVPAGKASPPAPSTSNPQAAAVAVGQDSSDKGKGKGKGSEVQLCHKFGDSSGCRFGDSCRFKHDRAKARKEGRCLACGQQGHIRPDCHVVPPEHRVVIADAGGEGSPKGGSVKGSPKGKAKAKAGPGAQAKGVTEDASSRSEVAGAAVNAASTSAAPTLSQEALVAEATKLLKGVSLRAVRIEPEGEPEIDLSWVPCQCFRPVVLPRGQWSHKCTETCCGR